MKTVISESAARSMYNVQRTICDGANGLNERGKFSDAIGASRESSTLRTRIPSE